MRQEILALLDTITAFDELEREHLEGAKAWINSGVEIFRIEKPATPPKHLVSFFMLFDPQSEKFLLVDHKKALEWLAPGGHVEKNEHPTQAVQRESLEELGIQAQFLFPTPFFITERVTVGITAGHTDVSLWYVLTADMSQPLTFDYEEFNQASWFSIDEILSIESNRIDPNIPRFVKKFRDSYLKK